MVCVYVVCTVHEPHKVFQMGAHTKLSRGSHAVHNIYVLYTIDIHVLHCTLDLVNRIKCDGKMGVRAACIPHARTHTHTYALEYRA